MCLLKERERNFLHDIFSARTEKTTVDGIIAKASLTNFHALVFFFHVHTIHIHQWGNGIYAWHFKSNCTYYFTVKRTTDVYVYV